MSRGKVRDYDAGQGYGIIVDSSTGQELTAYSNYINLKKGEILKEGQEVEYEIEHKRSENWAVNVKVLHDFNEDDDLTSMYCAND